MHNYASVTYINDSDKRKLSITKKMMNFSTIVRTITKNEDNDKEKKTDFKNYNKNDDNK